MHFASRTGRIEPIEDEVDKRSIPGPRVGGLFARRVVVERGAAAEQFARSCARQDPPIDADRRTLTSLQRSQETTRTAGAGSGQLKAVSSATSTKAVIPLNVVTLPKIDKLSNSE